ncbi:MAG: GDP-mannose 4,6-dehydratase [Deltaproteobacteria bacterium]|nr:GDP-mannose 4,6-dehydratase [Deltaproteobacteria bacterium]
MRRAIIAGIAGQDGSYLAELLVEKGYKVLGFLKKDEDTSTLARVIKDVVLEDTELVRKEDIIRWTRLFGPDEVYNFAAMSFIPTSWDDPYGAFQANTLLVAAFLEVLKNHCPSARFYQASYVASGILYNHESPRRQDHFVTQKIARAAAEISLGRSEKLKLGSIDARRDWGYAGDFVRGIWLMLQQPSAADYVLATGETHSIRDYLQEAFSHVGLRWEDWVETDPALVRPVDVGQLVGNPSRAKKFLGWIPEVSFPQLVRMMVDSQLERLKNSR